MALKPWPFTYILMGSEKEKKKKHNYLAFFDRLVIKEDFSWRTSVSLDRYILVGRKRSA